MLYFSVFEVVDYEYEVEIDKLVRTNSILSISGDNVLCRWAQSVKIWLSYGSFIIHPEFTITKMLLCNLGR